MTTVKAQVRVEEEPRIERKVLIVIDDTWFTAKGDVHDDVADRLWGLGVEEDGEVGAILSWVPQGVTVRKPNGWAEYTRTDDNWVRKELNITDDRIILVGDHGNLTLLKKDQVVVAQLSDLFYNWDDIDADLSDRRCPK